MKPAIFKTPSLLLFAISILLKPAAFAETPDRQVFEDDFAASRSENNGFAPVWGAPEKGGWTLRGKEVTRASAALDQVLPSKAVTLADKYIVSADVRVDTPDRAHFAGVAFNIQDEANFYVFRIAISQNENCGYYQMLKHKSGQGDAQWESWTGPSFSKVEKLTATTAFYKLIVESKGNGHFRFTIKDGAETLLNLDDEVSVRSDSYTGGYAGLYMGAAECAIANFHVETTPGANSKSAP